MIGSCNKYVVLVWMSVEKRKVIQTKVVLQSQNLLNENIIGSLKKHLLTKPIPISSVLKR